MRGRRSFIGIILRRVLGDENYHCDGSIERFRLDFGSISDGWDGRDCVHFYTIWLYVSVF